MKYLNTLIIAFLVFSQINLLASNNMFFLKAEKDTVKLTEVSPTSILEIIENNIVITWETLANKDCKGFEVEKSTDRKNWKKVGFVNAKKGATNYKFTDTTNFPISNYYRVKRVKSDDLGERAEIIIELKSAVQRKSFSMSSNPVGNYLMMNNSQGQITIFNTKRELVKQFRVREESIAIDTSDLPKGQYILQLQKEDFTTVSRLIVKN